MGFTAKKLISITSAPGINWNPVLTSTYAANIKCAYDGRDLSTLTLPSRVGPTMTFTNVTKSSDGIVFPGSNSSGIGNSSIACTYPFTIVFVTIGNYAGSPIGPGGQRMWFGMTSSNGNAPMAVVFSRSSQSLLGYNTLDNRSIGNYTPNGSEWFYVAVSFLNNSTARYYIRKLSGNLSGTISAGNSAATFTWFPSMGRWFGGNYPILGTMRLAMGINQGFSTESLMLDLFDTVKNGPAIDLLS